jgi:UDP-glucose 4-epimerase
MISQDAHILVTGGAGFIGSHLVERLLAAGARVTVIDDYSTGNAANLGAVRHSPRLRLIESKVSACRELPGIVADASFVFHLAAAVGVELVVNSPIRTIRTNLNETEAILDAASACGAPILVASTSEVYGKSRAPEFREEDDLLIGPPVLGRWSYACSKLMDEFLALAHMRERGLPVTVVRIFNTVGPRQTGHHGMVLPRFISAARAGDPLRVYGDGSQSRCFAWVGDTVESLLRLAGTPQARGEVVNIGSTEEISMRALAETVIARAKSASRLDFVPYAEAYAPGFEDMLRRCPCVEKLERLTGFRPRTSLADIIDRTLAALG